jgi:hypothetical protein
MNDKTLKVNIPAKYRVSHEEQFAQVTSKFLEYLKEGKLPEWEVQGIITKYFTTTCALCTPYALNIHSPCLPHST